MSRRTKTAWAVIDKAGHLYLFTVASTRVMAIAQHVHNTSAGGEEQPRMYAFGKLDALQRERWTVSRKRGERAVKVAVSWDPAA